MTTSLSRWICTLDPNELISGRWSERADLWALIRTSWSERADLWALIRAVLWAALQSFFFYSTCGGNRLFPLFTCYRWTAAPSPGISISLTAWRRNPQLLTGFPWSAVSCLRMAASRSTPPRQVTCSQWVASCSVCGLWTFNMWIKMNHKRPDELCVFPGTARVRLLRAVNRFQSHRPVAAGLRAALLPAAACSAAS